MNDSSLQLTPQSSRGCPYGHGCGNCPCAGECPTICGTSKAKSVKLQIGTGTHLGKLRIAGIPDKTKAPAIGVEPSQHAHFFRWNFGFVPRLGEDTFEGEKRPVAKISDDEFEIDVPKSWFDGSSAA